MKIVRFDYKGKIRYGLIEGDKVHLVKGSIYDNELLCEDEYFDLDKIRLLAPTTPSKIVCVGLNYKDHAKELSMPIPDEPIIFLKPTSAIIGPDDDIQYPPSSQRVDYEAELAVIIGKVAKSVAPQKASEYILGYTCLNDVTARDLQKKDGQWTRAKSFDTFCPVGPCIATGIDSSNLEIKLLVNDQVRQSSNTADMIFGLDSLISFISSVMTLLPGDIIATGTPKGVGPLARNDSIKLIIEGVGALSNKII